MNAVYAVAAWTIHRLRNLLGRFATR